MSSCWYTDTGNQLPCISIKKIKAKAFFVHETNEKHIYKRASFGVILRNLVENVQKTFPFIFATNP